MKYFLKISINGSFPSGVDDLGTYQVSERLYGRIRKMIEMGVELGEVKRV